MARSITRRKFIAGLAATSLLTGCDVHPIKGFLGAMKSWNETFEGAVFSPAQLAPELPLSAQTPEDDFPSYFISDLVPEMPDNWYLSVGGMVAHPLKLTLADIQKMPRTDMRVQHHCVEGWSAVASWHGVRVSEIAKMAGGIDPRARYVEFRSFDAGYWSSWDIASALHPQTILAYGMNGNPLGPGHGMPLRLYSAVKLGYKMVKYLTEVNFLPKKTGGYWEDQGYDWFGGV